MTINDFVFLIIVLLWLLILSSIYLKCKKSLKDLSKTKRKLEESKKILKIRIEAKAQELKEQADLLKKENEQKTEDLRERLKELEKLHRLAVGRELKMIELKEKIKKMEVQLREVNPKIRKK